MPEPNSLKLLLTHDTRLPSLSAVDSTMVSPLRAAPLAAPVDEACRGSNPAHSEAACAVESSCPSGTLTKSGSALYRNRSAKASFLASMSRCQYCGLLGPSSARVFPGAHFGTHSCRMLNISFAAQACEGGGSSSTSYP